MSGPERAPLPLYGVGPFYGAGVILSAAAGAVLALTGRLPGGEAEGIPAAVMAALGVLAVLLGAGVWVPAALGKRNIDCFIRADTLCTTGAYRFVRNPCYSGIALMAAGGLLLCRNYFLLVLPPLYWAAMTVLLRCTEEKWLLARYGEAYRTYCRRVNRCIPWFPRGE